MPRIVRIPMDDLDLNVKGGPVGCSVCLKPVTLLLRENRIFVICDHCRTLGYEIVDGDFLDGDHVG